MRHVGNRFYVVDHRGLAVESLDSGERRPEAWKPSVPFERIEKRALLAANVRSCAPMHDDVDVEAGAEDVGAEIAATPGLVNGGVEDLADVQKLTADVDEGLLTADGIG